VSLVSSRGIIRASKNPDCELLAAMALEEGNEKRFFKQLTGEEYPGEYGERNSARRRGAQFEANAHANDAARLKAALSPFIHVSPEDMVVRNFVDEFPGPINRIHAVRLHRVRRILRDLRAGRPVPHLLIQPTLALNVIDAEFGAFYISPDFLGFDPAIGMYRVGELKSFIQRDRASLDPEDLDNTRRQSAIGILALMDEAARHSLTVPEDSLALFVFSTPFGLKPADPHQERLLAEIEQIRRGVSSMRAAAARLAGMRGETDTVLANLADDLGTHYRESCVGSCLLAKRCESKDATSPARLGDNAVRVFGREDLDSVARLLAADPAELLEFQLEIRQKAQDAAAVLGMPYDDFVRMIA